MNLYDILACPVCKVAVVRKDETLVCIQCGNTYPIVNNVPVLLPDGSISTTQHQHELDVRPGYDPWIHRVVLQSLPASSIILDVGAGNLVLNLPNVIRMDVTLTPYVDIVGDAHALPFLPGTFDFIFSLAVFEHLRQPFNAAQEIYNALRNGGYAYHECNFVFAYHGYPHHYFGTTQQGIEQVFAPFLKIRSGVAPYQMPSFAIRMLLLSYLRDMGSSDDPDIPLFRSLLQNVLEQPLGKYDGLFTEDAALRTAAGVFYFGRKSVTEPSDVIPSVVQETWQSIPELQQNFPNLFDLGTAHNIMIWANQEGAKQFESIAKLFQDIVPFKKSEDTTEDDQNAFLKLPVVDPVFGNIGDLKRADPATRDTQPLHKYIELLEHTLNEKEQHITNLEEILGKIESGRIMKLLRILKR